MIFRFRKGDLVWYRDVEGIEKFGMVSGTSETSWYVPEFLISVDNTIMNIEESILSVIPREDIINWWDFL